MRGVSRQNTTKHKCYVVCVHTPRSMKFGRKITKTNCMRTSMYTEKLPKHSLNIVIMNKNQKHRLFVFRVNSVAYRIINWYWRSSSQGFESHTFKTLPLCSFFSPLVFYLHNHATITNHITIDLYPNASTFSVEM